MLQNAVKSDNIGASEILYNPLKQTLLLSNCKKGLVGVYDLRKNSLMKYLEVKYLYKKRINNLIRLLPEVERSKRSL